jgi:hypothetical protein
LIAEAAEAASSATAAAATATATDTDTDNKAMNVWAFMADHLDRYSTTKDLWKLDDDILREAAFAAGITRVDNPTHYFGAEAYNDWADFLTAVYGAGERQPSLWQALKCARQAWQAKASAPKDLKPFGGEKNMRTALFSVIKVEDAGSEQLSDGSTPISRQCDFCKKETTVTVRTAALLHKLTGESQFFCPFCVRNDHHTRKRNNILVLTLRGMVGYLFHFCYFGKVPKLFLSELEDLLAVHVAIGRQNPLFVYDPETYCWFIDFAKVGNTKRKIRVTEVIRTVNEMVSAFNPYDYIKDFKSHKFVDRFAEAINDFYSRRYRPKDKPICAPTLLQCASDMRDHQKEHTTVAKKVDIGVFRDFLPSSFQLHARR